MKQKHIGKTAAVLLPIMIIILLLRKEDILALVSYFPACSFYNAYDIYCPSCGNTRSVTALLQGDIPSSLRYNIIPVLLALMGILGYIELITYSFGRHIRLLPRRLSFYLILLAILMVYWIMRNFSPYLTP